MEGYLVERANDERPYERETYGGSGTHGGGSCKEEAFCVGADGC